MSSDARTTRLTASGAVVAGPGRVLGIYYVASATAGSVTITDGSGGATKIVVDTPALATAANFLSLEDMPLRCESSIYCVIANVTAVTVIYEG